MAEEGGAITLRLLVLLLLVASAYYFATRVAQAVGSFLGEFSSRGGRERDAVRRAGGGFGFDEKDVIDVTPVGEEEDPPAAGGR